MKIVEIQGLRGIAVLLVVLYHFQVIHGSAYLGVDLFFAISGFVITRIVSRDIARREFSFLAFIKRRFDRLFPPLAALVTVVILASIFVVSPESLSNTLATGIFALAGMSNLVIHVLTGDYFADAANSNALLHTWSLGVEEQVYFLIPVLLLIATLTRNHLRSSMTLFLGLSAGSLLMFFNSDQFVGVPIWGAVFSYYSPLIRFWEFGAGALAYLLSGNLKTSDKSRTLVHWVAFAVILFIPVLPLSESGLAHNTQALLVVSAAGFLLSSVEHSTAKSPFRCKALVFLGNRSYSLYLWHWPVAVFIGFISGWTFSQLSIGLGLMFSAALAEISYRGIELRRYGRVGVLDFRGRVAWALVPISAIFTSLTLDPLVNATFQAQANQRSKPTLLMELGCESGTWCHNDIAVDPPPRMLTNPVYLVGDSSAAMFHGGLLVGAREVGRDVVARTHGSCPGYETEFFRMTPSCLQYIEDLETYLTSASPGLVVFGVTDRYVIDAGDRASEASGAIARGLLGFARGLESLGHKVIIIETIPNLAWASGGFNPELWPRGGRTELALDLASERVANPWLRDFDSVRSAFPIFDTRSVLCPDSKCKVIEDGTYLYADENHITPYQSMIFAERWGNVLKASK